MNHQGLLDPWGFVSWNRKDRKQPKNLLKRFVGPENCRTAEGPGSATGQNQEEAIHQIFG